MQIEYKPLNAITPYPANAKAHPKEQVLQIANSIREFGFNQPIVIDKAGVIIVGHGRYEGAKYLKLTEAPTLTVNLTTAQAKAYRLADNKLNESVWAMDLVIEELRELELEGYDISLTGFASDLVLGDNPDTEFTLPEAGSGYEQITFTLSAEQTAFIKEQLGVVKKTAEYDAVVQEAANENSNGNAIYAIVKQWAQNN